MNLFLIQKGSGITDLWEDVSSAINVSGNPLLESSPFVAYELAAKIKLFETVERRFVLSNYSNDPLKFYIKRPHDVGNIATTFFDLNEVIDAHNAVENWTDYILFASILTNNSTQETVAKSASFFIRTKNGSVKDIRTGIIYDDGITLIPWFAVFKIKNTSLYYFILNHKTVNVGDLNENTNDNGDKVFVTDCHLGNLRNLIFKPTVSRNARIINDNYIFVKGDKFTLKPFDNWFLNAHYKNVFKPEMLKCSTNFEYSKDEQGIHFKITESDGYIIIRWPMEVSMLHGIFLRNKNTLYREYVVKQIKG